MGNCSDVTLNHTVYSVCYEYGAVVNWQLMDCFENISQCISIIMCDNSSKWSSSMLILDRSGLKREWQ